MRVAKFDGRSQLHLWSINSPSYLSAQDSTEAQNDLNRAAGGIGGREERTHDVNSHGQQHVEKFEKAWEFVMESMNMQPVEERTHAAGSLK